MTPVVSANGKRLGRRIALAWLGALITGAVSACPYSIRDSAFIGTDTPSTFRLYFLIDAQATDADQIAEWVDAASAAWLAEANVVAEVADVTGPQSHAVRGVLPAAFFDPANLPSAVLISPLGEALSLDGFSADNVSLDAVMDTVAGTIESPLRMELSEHLVESWCVLLVLEGSDPQANRRALEAAQRAGERITGSVTEMDKVIATGPHVVTVAPDEVAERVALWSLELGDAASADPAAHEVRVAMLTGRGERRGPLLSGEAITEQSIYDQLEMLGRSCSCTTDGHWLSGPVLPLEWTAATQARVIDTIGFDPSDPQAVGAINDVMTGLDSVLGFEPAGPQYRETVFAARAQRASDTTSKANAGDNAANALAGADSASAVANQGDTGDAAAPASSSNATIDANSGEIVVELPPVESNDGVTWTRIHIDRMALLWLGVAVAAVLGLVTVIVVQRAS